MLAVKNRTAVLWRYGGFVPPLRTLMSSELIAGTKMTQTHELPPEAWTASPNRFVSPQCS